MSGMVGGMAAPTATALAARTSGGASLSATRPVSLPGVSDSLNRRLAVGSRRPRARTAPVIAVAGSTSPAPDGRPRTASSSPRPGSEIVTAAVSDPSTVTVEDEFHRRSSELGRTKKKKKGGRAAAVRAQQGPPQVFSPGRRSTGLAPRQAPRVPPSDPLPRRHLHTRRGASRPAVRNPGGLRPSLHNAVELLRALRDAGLDGLGARVSHKNFLRQCARREAVAVAFEFVAFVDHPDVRLYNMLLSVCAAAGDSRSGFAAFVLMYDAGVEPDCRAYTTLISACAKAGELEKAFETFRRMEMDGVSPSVVTYGALMDALSRRVGALTGGSRAGAKTAEKPRRREARGGFRRGGSTASSVLRPARGDGRRGGGSRRVRAELLLAACGRAAAARISPRTPCPRRSRCTRRWKRPGSRATPTRTRRSSPRA